MYLFKMILGLCFALYLVYTTLKDKYFFSAGIAGILFLAGLLAITTDILNNISFWVQFIVVSVLGIGFVFTYKYESGEE
ncbi:hypothetical protein BK704_09565 [[Bacillus thuringiensis] serovar konkukian]|nr:hypothetical protein [Bacillus thuringiensis]MED1304289.1 hypothetical protein [Bacillus pacificus]OUB14064.1 hypothetical protein BK704_09565 [[Bacillus thuringiensis] serovar konkukian]